MSCCTGRRAHSCRTGSRIGRETPWQLRGEEGCASATAMCPAFEQRASGLGPAFAALSVVLYAVMQSDRSGATPRRASVHRVSLAPHHAGGCFYTTLPWRGTPDLSKFCGQCRSIVQSLNGLMLPHTSAAVP